MKKRTDAMKHFLIYTNRHKDKNLATTARIERYLRERGQRVTVRVREGDWKNRINESVQELEELPEDADLMLVLGGDGTMLQAVRETKKSSIPIIGVNLGTLGYMTEVEPANLEEALERLIAGDYARECRMMLKGRISFGDGRREEDWALNDIVISRSGSLQIIRLNIYVNGQFLNRYNADGVIITTPTGSSGYNLSAGGPLVEPGAKLIMLTPICPHTLNKGSIILSAEDVIEIEIPKGREEREQTVEANFDGSHVVSLRTGDRIHIVKSDEFTEFIQLNKVSFVEVLHKKLSES